MDEKLFREALLKTPPWYFFGPRLSKYPSLLDAFGVIKPEVASEITGVLGACAVNLSKSEFALIEKGEYDKLRAILRTRVERWPIWEEEKHKKAALAHIDSLSDDGFKDIAKNPWSPKLSFIPALDSTLKTTSMPLGSINFVTIQQIITDVPSLFLINASGNVFYNPQLEGLACLPKGSLDFRGKGKAAFRDAFSNFMALVRANAAASEVMDLKEGDKPIGDYQTLSLMYISRLFYNTKLDNENIITPIVAAGTLRSFILGQPLFFAKEGQKLEADSEFIKNITKDFDNFRADCVFAMAGIAEPSAEQKDEVKAYLSINSDLLSARQKNLTSVGGFFNETRRPNDAVIGNLASALDDMYKSSKVLQTLFAEKPELKDILATTDEGYIKGFQDPKKLLDALGNMPSPKTAYPTLNLTLFSAVFDGLYMKRIGPVPPDYKAPSGMATWLASRYER